MTVKTAEIGTKELWEQFSENPIRLYQRIADEMKDRNIKDAPTLSRALEYASPSGEKEELDAFERLMREAGIITESRFSEGYYASTGEAFTGTPARRALGAEYAMRQWRQVSFGEVDLADQRAVLLSGDAPVGSWERPYAEAQTPRLVKQIQPAIPLNELVAMNTPINSTTYRSYYLDNTNAKAMTKVRVGESAEIPTTHIKGKEKVIDIYKYARALEMSYESMQEVRIDKIGLFIRWMAVHNDAAKVATALDVLINGDGNVGTAATNYNLTTTSGSNPAMDPAATPGSLTMKGWLAFGMEWEGAYMLTTALMQKAMAIQLRTLNAGTGNIMMGDESLAELGLGLRKINRTADSVAYGWLTEAPANKIVGFDRRFALERVVQVGATISEMERYITKQTEILTFSEIEGFGILDSNATKVLSVNQ